MHRDMKPEEIDALLYSQTFGNLACQQDGKPYIIPLAFFYDLGTIYGQTMEGKKTEILRHHPQVCFHVQELQPDGWRSVLCWGMFEELDLSVPLAPPMITALQGLATRLGVVQQSVGVKVLFDAQEGMSAITGPKGTVFRIRVTEKTGRAFHAD